MKWRYRFCAHVNHDADGFRIAAFNQIRSSVSQCAALLTISAHSNCLSLCCRSSSPKVGPWHLRRAARAYDPVTPSQKNSSCECQHTYVGHKQGRPKLLWWNAEERYEMERKAKDKRKKKKRDESRCLHLLTTKLLSTMSTIYALPKKRENNLTTLPETFNVITINTRI